MTWSTREIAELADVSRRTVRHYTDIGLLEPPERRANGYRHYGPAHLRRLRRIRRLRELGLSLSEIAALDEHGDHPERTARSLDAALAGTVERLQRIRDEVGRMRAERTPTDLPVGFVPPAVGTRMPPADRSYLVVMSRVLGPQPLQDYVEFLRDPPTDPASLEFDRLCADADDRTCRDLGARMAPVVRGIHARHPALKDLHAGAPLGRRRAGEITAAATGELYNAAQLAVLRTIRDHLAGGPSARG